MKINVINIDKFVEINKCPRVTNPIYFDGSKNPVSDGLLSFELFGLPNSYDRKTVWGYIDLKRPFLHPVFYKILTSMDRRFYGIINGDRKFIINKFGEMVEDEEKGETGLDFIYKNLKKIDFKRNSSIMRNEKLLLLEQSKIDEIFCTKFLVMPAFYRDYNFQEESKGKQDVGEINPIYSRLINLTNSLVVENDANDIELGSFSLSFMGNVTENKIQSILNELYTLFTSALAKKTGYIRKSLLGKSVDYATRSVISAPHFRADSWTNQQVPFNYTGIPLSQVLVLFLPQMKFQIQSMMETYFEAKQYITVLDRTGKSKRLTLKDPMEDFSAVEIEKMIELYIKSPDNRYDKVMVNTEELGRVPIGTYREDLRRDYTIMDLLFIAATEVVKDKAVYITRYPVESYQSCYPSRIKIITTYNTEKKRVGGLEYEDYPVLTISESKDGKSISKVFYDSVIPNNSMLAALGGDYDGDTVSIRGLYSQEANMEAFKLLESTKHLLDGNGKPIRTLNNEAFQTIYALTQDR